MSAPLPAPVQETEASAVRMPSMPVIRGHLPPLDGMRGIAVLAVMAFHFAEFSNVAATTAGAGVWSGIASVGWIGVDLFFVLSGFLITGILYDSKADARYFRTFYARRALRIFPLYYGVLAAFFLLLPALFPASALVRDHTADQAWYWTHLSNVEVALQGTWLESSLFVVHFWSLAIEEQFYLVWPIAVLWMSGRHLTWFCGGVIAFSLLLRVVLFANGEGVAAATLMPARMDSLAFGAALAMVLRDPGLYAQFRPIMGRLAGASALLLGAILVETGRFDKNDPLTGTVGFTLLGALFTAAMFFALTVARDSRYARVLSSPGLRFFGKYSYGLYVFHQPVAVLLTIAGVPAALAGAGASALGVQAAYTAVATVASLAIALTSWHLYEKHFLKLKARVPHQPAPVTTPAPGYACVVNSPN